MQINTEEKSRLAKLLVLYQLQINRFYKADGIYLTLEFKQLLMNEEKNHVFKFTILYNICVEKSLQFFFHKNFFLKILSRVD